MQGFEAGRASMAAEIGQLEQDSKHATAALAKEQAAAFSAVRSVTSIAVVLQISCSLLFVSDLVASRHPRSWNAGVRLMDAATARKSSSEPRGPKQFCVPWPSAEGAG